MREAQLGDGHHRRVHQCSPGRGSASRYDVGRAQAREGPTACAGRWQPVFFAEIIFFMLRLPFLMVLMGIFEEHENLVTLFRLADVDDSGPCAFSGTQLCRSEKQEVIICSLHLSIHATCCSRLLSFWDRGTLDRPEFRQMFQNPEMVEQLQSASRDSGKKTVAQI